MTPKTYEKALLALRSYQAAQSDNIDEILAVACVLRNRVLKYGKTYTQVLEAAEVSRPWPAVNNPILSDPQNGILALVDDVYDNIAPDYSANHLHKDGALFFGRSQDHFDKKDWFDLNILSNPNEHPLIGNFGTMGFYA